MQIRSSLAFVLVASAALSASAAAPPKLRLDDGARPTRYDARITVNPADPTFHGSIDIDLAIRKPTDTLWLNATELTIEKAAFTIGGATVPARIIAGNDDFVGFAAGKALPAGAAKLHVEWKGPISRKEDRGLFAQNENGRWYAITQFEAIFARRVFPCFDEPNIKVPWRLTLEVPKALVALSNTSPTDEKSERPGMKTLTFAETPPLPSYLVAFAVGPYDLVDAGTTGRKKTPMHVAAPFGRAKDAGYAQKNAPVFVKLLEDYFGIPFPYDKLDSVAIPITSTFGAMENAGMVTFALNLLIAKPTAESIHFERDFAETAAHEYAHQWFGDLVTTAWWNDIWLNESFASWLEDKMIDQWKPEWHHGTSYVDARARALDLDTLVSTRQVRQPILSNDDIYNAFDPITYQKGESVLAMFERFVGLEKFRAGVHAYLTKHANGNATADDFIGAIAASAGRPEVTPAFKSFLDQPGAPMVDVTLACNAGKAPSLHVKQQRFLPVGSKGSPNQQWQIPMCVRWTAADGKPGRSCTLVTKKEQDLPLGASCPAWLLANDGELGYYRAAYPAAMLQKLLDSDGRKRLDLPETVGLLDDVHALVEAGRVPLGDALALTPSLAEDARRHVQRFVIDTIDGLHHHLVPAAERASYVRYVDKIYADKAHALGWTPKAGEDEDTRLLRAPLVSLVARQGEDKTLAAEAHKLALKWLVDRKAVSPDVAGAVLDTAARVGDRALFDKMHAAAKKAGDRHDRQMILSAMGEFRDPAIAKSALQIVAGTEFDPRESMDILYGLSGQAETRQLAWDFLKTNFETLEKRLSAEQMAYAPYLGITFCDEAHQKDMEAFFKDRSPKLPGGPRIFAQAIERSELCRAYVAAQQPSVDAFLKKY
ncbi:MAG TPA: M1 family metallopeptidase [Polyangia bacterium]|nr:M1 family metallopeptidase [Polyangia bacterium]